MSENLKPSRLSWQDIFGSRNSRATSTQGGNASAFAAALGVFTRGESQATGQVQQPISSLSSTSQNVRTGANQQAIGQRASRIANQLRALPSVTIRPPEPNPAASATSTAFTAPPPPPSPTQAAKTVSATAASIPAVTVLSTAVVQATASAAPTTTTANIQSSTPLYIDPYQPNLDIDQVPREYIPPGALDWYDKRQASIASANMPERDAASKAYWDWRDDMVRGGILPAVTGGASREDILKGVSSWSILQGIAASTKAAPNGLYTLADLQARQLKSSDPKDYFPPANAQPFVSGQPTPAPPTWTPAPAPQWDADGKPVIGGSTPTTT